LRILAIVSPKVFRTPILIRDYAGPRRASNVHRAKVKVERVATRAGARLNRPFASAAPAVGRCPPSPFFIRRRRSEAITRTVHEAVRDPEIDSALVPPYNFL